MFDRYQQHRAWSLSPNAVMEAPALFEELGPAAGLRVLDLGCGDAQVGRKLLSAGASRYLGIDGSERMVEIALRELEGTVGEVVRCDIEDRAEPGGSFGLVLSRMASHYVADLGEVLRGCYRCLVPGGRILLTIAEVRPSRARAGSLMPTSSPARGISSGSV